MNFRKLAVTVSSSIGILAMAAGIALAQTPTIIKQFNAWGAYSYKDGNSKTCYILSVPTAKSPKNVNHGDIFFLVSRKSNQNTAYEPQIEVGYELKITEKVIVDVDGKKFMLFSKGRNAWVENAAEEPALVAAMRKGSKMTVSAQSKRGTKTSYSYSLSGVSAALDQIKSCK
jgi:invasion protein IalB